MKVGDLVQRGDVIGLVSEVMIANEIQWIKILGSNRYFSQIGWKIEKDEKQLEVIIEADSNENISPIVVNNSSLQESIQNYFTKSLVLEESKNEMVSKYHTESFKIEKDETGDNE